MIGEKAAGLVPPRPNLGPEPWRDPAPDWRMIGVSSLLAATVLLAGWWGWRRRSLRKSEIVSAGDRASVDPGPRGRLLALSAGLRDELSGRLGTSFRARTTEEIAADDRVAGLLGEEPFRQLLQFLDLVDRIKFAPDRDEEGGEEMARALSVWEPTMAAIASLVRSRPRPRSRPETSSDRRGPDFRGRAGITPRQSSEASFGVGPGPG